jgi:hypothetical protein
MANRHNTLRQIIYTALQHRHCVQDMGSSGPCRLHFFAAKPERSMKSMILSPAVFVPDSCAQTLSADTPKFVPQSSVNRRPGMARAPKLLPWIARKAGIPHERAEAIWLEAVCHASRQNKGPGTPDYARVVMEQLYKLVEQEKVAALARQPDGSG